MTRRLSFNKTDEPSHLTRPDEKDGGTIASAYLTGIERQKRSYQTQDREDEGSAASGTLKVAKIASRVTMWRYRAAYLKSES